MNLARGRGLGVGTMFAQTRSHQEIYGLQKRGPMLSVFWQAINDALSDEDR